MEGRKAPATTRRYELRVARLHATSISESRRLFDNEDVMGAAPYDWSPDGKWIAVGISRKDDTGQIGLIGVQDGSLRVLKSLDWKEPTKIFFSPDGKYIAYDLMVTDSSDERHVFVMAVDGSREAAVVAHPESKRDHGLVARRAACAVLQRPQWIRRAYGPWRSRTASLWAHRRW